jgi:lysophospholipid acyltransferase (LPLAT)-like uncharacterized protein
VAIRLLLGLLGRSYRVSVVGEPSLRECLTDDRPFILSFWHDSSFIVTYTLRRLLLGGRRPVTLLASRSRDGELVTRIVRPWGLDVVRGSTSKGGREALTRLYRALQNGSIVILPPDGPRGPSHHAKAGTITLAQMAQVPVLPLAAAAESVWRLRSWDRMVVPKPFTRLTLIAGKALQVPRTLDETARDEHRRRLESALEDLVERAAAAQQSTARS